MASMPENSTFFQSTLNVRLKMKEFEIPPITDALVIGRHAPIGAEAIKRALTLLQVAPFEYIELEDDVISDVLVRASVLKKIPQDKLISLVLRRVKPFMTIDEVTHLDVETDMNIEESI